MAAIFLGDLPRDKQGCFRRVKEVKIKRREISAKRFKKKGVGRGY